MASRIRRFWGCYACTLQWKGGTRSGECDPYFDIGIRVPSSRALQVKYSFDTQNDVDLERGLYVVFAAGAFVMHTSVHTHTHTHTSTHTSSTPGFKLAQVPANPKAHGMHLRLLVGLAVAISAVWGVGSKLVSFLSEVTGDGPADGKDAVAGSSGWKGGQKAE
eukprot:scaffold80614_cov18-Tisochrysis_lutea.AAC.1